ncbi:MAG: putative DNA binding domain-containing protein, partial [Candidatus Cloacimonetes bacterium]|nr:putative DNA binding domain-containing protein [Candidatus Cloacimonadota bacterium]
MRYKKNMKPESLTFEYKEEFNEGVFKTISAFSNTKGGKILIGVTNKGNIKGISISNKEFENFVNRIVNLLGIHPGMEIITLENKPIMKISIQESNLPISYKGKYYKRVGNTTRLMKDDELRNFFIKGINWDGFTGNYTLEDIQEKTIRRFQRMAIENGRLQAGDEKDSIQNVLEKLKLIDEDKLTNAAIMLFGKDPQKYFINTVVRIGRFKDQSTIIGDRTIGGNLFDIVGEAEETIKQFINVRYEIIDSFQRKDIWDYPLPAIREALFNAVIHRDYFKFNIQIQIKIFDDHIWFYNPGSLPEGMTIERLKTTHPSISRNPLIMNVFYLAGFVEEYG